MVTQKDIAGKLGVSISLVSRVLSGKAREIGIAEETIKMIEDTAREANYIPNSAALNLKGVKTRTLGVVTYDFEDPYLGFILAQLQKIAHEQNYSLILTGTYRRESENLDITPFIKHNIEGLIIVGSDRSKTWHASLAAKKIPTVQIGFTEDKKGTVLCVDAKKAVSKAVRHIKKSGYMRPALLFNDSLSHEIYLVAYQKELTKAGLKTGSVFRELNSEFVKKLPDVLICGDDLLAMEAVRFLQDNGINVPRDLKLIGFDDIPLSSTFIPSLTTLAPPLTDMISQAFEIAVSHKHSSRTFKFVPELIVRESC